MSEMNDEINIVEILMTIKEDVSSIKTDMANFKEAQRIEKDTIMNNISGIKESYEKDLKELRKNYEEVKEVQKNIISEINILKNADAHNDAKKWRATTTFIVATVAGMMLAKLPDFIVFLVSIKK